MHIYIYFRQNITKRIFAVVYCGSLNGCFVFAKTFKLLDDFPHGGFSSVCIFSCSVEPLMQEKKKVCMSFLQSSQTLKHYHFNITLDLYVLKKIGYNLLL